MIQVLKRARALIATGWAGPGPFEWQCRGRVPGVRICPAPKEMGLTTDVAPCSWRDEAVTHFSVEGALRAAGGVEDVTEAWDALEHVLGDPLDVLRLWLCAPERKLEEVMVLFDKAILRAKRAGA